MSHSQVDICKPPPTSTWAILHCGLAGSVDWSQVQPVALWQNNTCKKKEKCLYCCWSVCFIFFCFATCRSKTFSVPICLQLKSVNSSHSYVTAALWNSKAPSAGILEGMMLVTKSLQAWNNITVTVPPCTQSGVSLNSYWTLLLRPVIFWAEIVSLSGVELWMPTHWDSWKKTKTLKCPKIFLFHAISYLSL